MLLQNTFKMTITKSEINNNQLPNYLLKTLLKLERNKSEVLVLCSESNNHLIQSRLEVLKSEKPIPCVKLDLNSIDTKHARSFQFFFDSLFEESKPKTFLIYNYIDILKSFKESELPKIFKYLLAVTNIYDNIIIFSFEEESITKSDSFDITYWYWDSGTDSPKVQTQSDLGKTFEKSLFTSLKNLFDEK